MSESIEIQKNRSENRKERHLASIARQVAREIQAKRKADARPNKKGTLLDRIMHRDIRKETEH